MGTSHWAWPLESLLRITVHLLSDCPCHVPIFPGPGRSRDRSRIGGFLSLSQTLRNPIKSLSCIKSKFPRPAWAGVPSGTTPYWSLLPRMSEMLLPPPGLGFSRESVNRHASNRWALQFPLGCLGKVRDLTERPKQPQRRMNESRVWAWYPDRQAGGLSEVSGAQALDPAGRRGVVVSAFTEAAKAKE